MNDERGRALDWILEFIYMDFEKMDRSEIQKTGIDLQTYVFPDWQWIPPIYSERELRKAQEALKGFFFKFLEPVLKGKKERSRPLPRPPEWIDRFFMMNHNEALHYAAAGRSRSRKKGETSIADEAVERFIGILSASTPLDKAKFQSCEECGRWHFGKRSKRFCSSKCNWKFNARARRGTPGSKKRKQYNEAQRQIMKKAYRKKCGLKT